MWYRMLNFHYNTKEPPRPKYAFTNSQALSLKYWIFVPRVSHFFFVRFKEALSGDWLFVAERFILKQFGVRRRAISLCFASRPYWSLPDSTMKTMQIVKIQTGTNHYSHPQLLLDFGNHKTNELDDTPSNSESRDEFYLVNHASNDHWNISRCRYKSQRPPVLWPPLSTTS